MPPAGLAPLGRQVALDLLGCSPQALADAGQVAQAFREAARAAKATVVAEAWHDFPGGGISGVLVLAESHLAVHTWPESGYAAVDGFMCGPLAQPEAIALPLAASLGAASLRSQVWARGLRAAWPPLPEAEAGAGGGSAEVEARLKEAMAERDARLFAQNNALATQAAALAAQAKALQTREERFRALSFAALEGVAIADGGQLVEVNEAFLQLMGLSWREEALGQPVEAFLAPEALEAHAQLLAQEQPKPLDLMAQRPDGSLVPVELHLRQLYFDDKVLQVTVFRDATERRRLERMREAFVAVVSHDLKNPLGALAASIEGLNESVRPQLRLGEAAEEDLAFFLDTAQKSIARLLRLTNELLDDERLLWGRSPLKQSHFEVGPLLEEACDTMLALAQASGVRLGVEAPPLPLVADRDRLLQVLTNLLGNAIKFSPPGGQVLVRAEAEPGALRLVVEDEGRGIPADKLEAIFERFTQVELADATDKGGSGLGLAICRSIVKRHGGRIWAERRPGGGSRFVLHLPQG